MGKASRLKKERRLVGSERHFKAPRHAAKRQEAANPHAAAPGPHLQVWIAGGSQMTGHELVEQLLEGDDLAGLKLAHVIFEASGASLLDLQFVMRRDDGTSFNASIFHHAWGLRAPACFEWLLAQGGAQNHEGLTGFVQQVLLVFQAIDRHHETWEKLCWGLRSLVLLMRESATESVLEALRSKGGNLEEFAMLIEAEELAEAERVELGEILAPRPTKRAALAL